MSKGLLTSALWCVLVVVVVCVGPSLRQQENVAIFHELKVITDLILKSQNKEVQKTPLQPPVIHDCFTLHNAGIRASGVYSVFPYTFRVYCDMVKDGGGWTVIQRRSPQDLHENFNRSWTDYRNGFGDLEAEFWLGLQSLHQLTHSGDHELRIDMVDYQLGPKFAKYKMFRVGPESDGYRLLATNYSGNAGDALSIFHSGRRFSTFDRDQDLSRNRSCAVEKEGGWWFHACYAAHLNGRYPQNPRRDGRGPEIRWWSDRENVLVLTSVEMKIRRLIRQPGYVDDNEENIPDPQDAPTAATTVTEDESLGSSTPGMEEEDRFDDGGDGSFIFNDTGVYDYDEGRDYNSSHGRSDTNPWEMSKSPGYE